MRIPKLLHSHLLSSALILAGVGCLFMSSCKHRPSDIIGEKDMVEVMADLQLAEAYSSTQMNGSGTDAKREFAASVLAYHGVTQEQLDSTLQWYGRNLDDYVALYEKVDKRLGEKKRELIKDDADHQKRQEGDNLWLGSSNGVISPLGTSDGWVFSFDNPELERGDRLVWSMHLKDATQPINGVMGVEYDDGSSEAGVAFFTSRASVELNFQTDTAKSVRRIYGTMRLKNPSEEALYADSISLRRLPFDSVEYYRHRMQKRYGIPVRRDLEKERLKHKADSIRRDSLKNVEKLKKETKRNEQ